MTLGELEALFRSDVKDTAKPYLFSSTDVVNWLNEGEEEAVIRADLLPESADAPICTITVTAGAASYALSPLVTRVTYAAFTPTGCTDPVPLKIETQRAALDRFSPDWRTRTDKPCRVLIEKGIARFDCLPEVGGVLSIEVYRLPLERMEDDADTPEIQAVHHRHLVRWAEHRAYTVPDAETRDPQRAAAALAEFEAHFGLRPDADNKQATEAVPQFNQAIW